MYIVKRLNRMSWCAELNPTPPPLPPDPVATAAVDDETPYDPVEDEEGLTGAESQTCAAPDNPTLRGDSSGPDNPVGLGYMSVPDNPARLGYMSGPDNPAGLSYMSGPDNPAGLSYMSGPDNPAGLGYMSGPDNPVCLGDSSGSDNPMCLGYFPAAAVSYLPRVVDQPYSLSGFADFTVGNGFFRFLVLVDGGAPIVIGFDYMCLNFFGFRSLFLLTVSRAKLLTCCEIVAFKFSREYYSMVKFGLVIIKILL